MEIKPAKAMHHLLRVVDDWRSEYHSKQNGDIVFQNKELKSNIFFTSASLHTIAKHSTGFENIPLVLMKPDEVWMRWEDTTSQEVVLRNYIKFGKLSYVVQTRNGVVTDAFAVSNTAANNFRKGVIA